MNYFADSFWKRVDNVCSMSLRELADKTGLVYGTIKNQRARSVLPKQGAVTKIAEALGVCEEYLLYGYSTSNNFSENFWNGIESYCKEKGIEKRYLYEETGLNPKLVVNWEQQRTLPPIEIILKFAAYLEIDIYWLMYGDRIPNARFLKDIMHKEYHTTLEGALAEIETLKKEISRLKRKSS